MTEADDSYQVLVIDDDATVRALLQATMKHADGLCWAGEAPNGEIGIDLALREEPDAVILDLEMPGIDGVETLRRLRASGFAGVIAMYTSQPPLATEARALGADDIFKKDKDVGAFMVAVRDLCIARSRGRLTG